MPVPARPMIYHITRVENLADIIKTTGLLSDREMIQRGGPRVAIGMSTLKVARLARPVRCHAGDFVGDYVPFYFCPRSIMLYILDRGNHPDVEYRGGQGNIVHLEADLHKVIAWGNANNVRWAFTLSNAAGTYAEFRDDAADLGQINWAAVAATNFRSSDVNDGKQAEFLVRQFFPWNLIERIGVHSRPVAAQVSSAQAAASHRPTIEVRPEWYY
jgi:hypothetical protein